MSLKVTPEMAKLYSVGDVLDEERFDALLGVMDKIVRGRIVEQLTTLQAEYSRLGIQIGVATIANAITLIEKGN